MKEIYWNILFGFSFLALVIACTKEITEDALQRSFSFEFTENEITSILNIPQSATFTINSPGATSQENFRFKYNVTQGAGFFVINEVVIEENELISLPKGSSFTIEYVGVQAGEHKVSVALRDGRNEEKEVQLVFNVKDSAFEITIVPDAPSTYVDGIVDLDFTIMEVIPAEYSLVYTFVGADADGAGKGTISRNGISIEPEKEVSIENIEEFTLQFTGKELGVATLEVAVKSNLGKELIKEIEIEITETPDFKFIAMLEGADPTTNQVETFIQTPVTVNFEIEETVASSSYKGTYTSTNDGSFVYNDISYSAGQEIPMETGVSSGQYISEVAGDHKIVFTVANANVVPVTRDAEFTIVCKDPEVENPIIMLLGDNQLIWDVNEEFVDPGFTVIDNDDPDIESKVEVTGEVDVTVPGTYELTYNVQDASGNMAETKMREVLVKDRIAPVISLNGDNPIVLALGSNWLDPASATDNYESDDEITQKIVYSGNYTGTSAEGSYIRTYNVSDASGNAAEEVTRTIEVKVLAPPVITLNESDTRQVIQQGEAYVELGATVNDGSQLTIDSSAVNTAVSTQTGYDVIYSATNIGGTTKVIRKVYVNAPPVITLVGNEDIMVNGAPSYTDEGASANDTEDGPLTPMITSNNVVSNELGDYTVTYSVTDSDDKTVSKDRKVKVIDTEPPLITLNGLSEISIDQGVAYEENGATVTDNIINEAPLDIQITGNVNTNIPETYKRMYNVQDASGNKAIEVVRTIIVKDITPPVITLNQPTPSPLIHALGTTYTDPGATATDNVDPSPSLNIIVDNPVDENKIGNYTVTYTARDAAGNEGRATRAVKVEAIEPTYNSGSELLTASPGVTVNFTFRGPAGGVAYSALVNIRIGDPAGPVIPGTRFVITQNDSSKSGSFIMPAGGKVYVRKCVNSSTLDVGGVLSVTLPDRQFSYKASFRSPCPP